MARETYEFTTQHNHKCKPGKSILQRSFHKNTFQEPAALGCGKIFKIKKRRSVFVLYSKYASWFKAVFSSNLGNENKQQQSSSRATRWTRQKLGEIFLLDFCIVWGGSKNRIPKGNCRAVMYNSVCLKQR